jgi:hypothetical protein
MANIKLPTSTKHAQINKAQSTMFATITVATVVTIFCLVSAKALLSQAAYQRKVVNANHVAVKQLQTNVTAAKQLDTQYNSVFESGTTNIIGGKNDSSSDAVPPNGDNARIVLDALPSRYDFPALVSSLSKLLNADGIGNQSVTGTDQSVTVGSNDAASSPQPVQIQLTVAGTASYGAVQSFIKDLERSIRPFDVTNLQLSGPQGQLTFNLTVNTYYQPAKSLSITTKEIR